MKITRVIPHHLRLDELKAEADGTQEILLVEVQSDEGISGWGEIVSSCHVAKAIVSAPPSLPFRQGLANIVTGMEIENIEKVFDEMVHHTSWYGPGGVTRHAMSGIEMALWDLQGKAQGKPVHELLQPNCLRQVNCYASVLWPQKPELLRESAATFNSEGYRAIKYGWAPMGQSESLDIELVACAREFHGTDIEIMVDAGRVWDVDTALKRAERFAEYKIRWLEEPLDPYDHEGYRVLSESSPVPIASGEVHALKSEFDSLAHDSNISILQPDLGRVGGITGARRIADISSGKDLIPHAFGTGVLLSASAHFAATLGCGWTEYTRTHSPLARDLVHHDLSFKDGILHLGDKPGLGVDIDQEVLRRYRVN